MSDGNAQREIDVPDDVSPLEDGPADVAPGDVDVEVEMHAAASASKTNAAAKIDRLVAETKTQQRPPVAQPQAAPSKTSSTPREQVVGARDSAARPSTPGAASSVASPPPRQQHVAAPLSQPPTSQQPHLISESLFSVRPTVSISEAPNAAGLHGGLLAVPDWVRLHPTLGTYFAEIIGTFIFVLTIALVEINNPLTPDHPETNIAPMPIGFALTVMVFTFGYISGGHFNPAVSLAVTLARNSEFGYFRAGMYMICQVGAALGAGVVAMIVQGSNDIIVPDVSNDGTYIRKGIFAELIYTFALATVVLNVAYSRQKANFFYGFAIGFVVIAGASAVGGVTGGAFNPAVATGLQAAVCLVGRCKPLMHFWLYWLAPFIGSILAALLFSAQYVPEQSVTEADTAADRVIR